MTSTNGHKVLIVCAIDISAAKLLSAQARALEQAGFDVHIACADGQYARSMVKEGYRIQCIPITNRPSPIASLRSIRALYKLMRREGYDIVHVHMISAAFLGRIAAKLARVPLVFYTFRGFAFYNGSPYGTEFFNIMIERVCAPFTDFVFSQSEENRRRAVLHRVIDAKRSVTIGNGIALEEFLDHGKDPDEALCIREELGIASEAAVVGFVGRLVKEKGLYEYIESATEIVMRVPNAIFLIVGDALSSDTGVRKELEELVRANGLLSRFIWTGYRSDVARLYHAMNVFVLPSYREGMPRSIMEAMASGKPVVATDIPGCRDEVVDGVTGILVPARDARALGEAIVWLLQNPVIANRMGRAGRERAEANFDERIVCERIVDRYKAFAKKMNGRHLGKSKG